MAAATLVRAIRKAWLALKEGRLPASPTWWFRALALHMREERARHTTRQGEGEGETGAARFDRDRLNASYAEWLAARAPGGGTADVAGPPISIVALVRDDAHATDLVRTVLAQSFGRWDLWFLHDEAAPPDGLVPLARHDPRIRCCSLESLTSAGGRWMPPGHSDYVVLMDASSLLAPGSLAHVSTASRTTGADWIFTDDDLLDATGARIDPNLKGDFSLELSMVDDYATRLATVSRRAIETSGGLDRSLRSAQIHDLLLRIVEQGGHVHHLAEVCCHRRAPVHDHLTDDQRLAAGQSLVRRDLSADVVVEPPVLPASVATPRVMWTGTRGGARVTIVIPTRDRAELLSTCVSSLERSVAPEHVSLLIVDDDSQDASALVLLKALEREGPFSCRVERTTRAKGAEEAPDAGFNYSRLMNIAARAVETPLMLHLNNDVQGIAPGWLEQMAGWFQCHDIGVAGPKLLYPDGSVQHAGVVVMPDQIPEHLFCGIHQDDPGYQRLPHMLRNVSAVTGACLMTRTELFVKVGGFDELNLAVQFNDIDYCLKVIDAGYRIVYEPAAVLRHAASASRGSQYDYRENLFFLNKYRGRRDPFVSPHLEPASLFGPSPLLRASPTST